MVDFIKAWGTALVSAAVIGSICNLLLPKHAIAKVAKMLVGVYLAIVIISPLLKAEVALPDSVSFEVEQTYAETMYDDAVMERTADNIGLQIVQRLEQDGIVCDDIAVSVNINETDGIYCDEVVIHLNRSFQTQEQQIKTTVATFCGTAPLLAYGD